MTTDQLDRITKIILERKAPGCKADVKDVRDQGLEVLLVIRLDVSEVTDDE